MSRNVYIAVIDDDDSVGASLGRLLRQARFQPISYLSAEAYLADENRPRFDCLLLDVRLGGISGLDLLAQFAANKPHPPVIFITALDDPAARAKAQALGCAGFFLKSTPGVDVIEAILRATRDSTAPPQASGQAGTG